MKRTLYTLITGASQGLGKALAVECARRKMNLVLVALPGPSLHALASFLRANFDIEVLCIEADLSKSKGCELVYRKVGDENIALNVLINNAGVGGYFGFDQKESGFYREQVQLNAIAPTTLVRLFVNDLKRHAPSYILNVSSLASFFSLPGKMVYAASKMYLVSFSRSLACELGKHDVHVSVLCPGGMNTNLPLMLLHRNGTRITRWSVMNPEDVAAIAIQSLFRKKKIIIPGRWNRFFLLLNAILPLRLKDYITRRQMEHAVTSKHMSPDGSAPATPTSWHKNTADECMENGG